MAQAKHLEMQEIVQQVMNLTQELLASGGHPAQVVFALTTIAADMGFETTENPYQVISVLMDAISYQSKRRHEADESDQENEQSVEQDDAPELEVVAEGVTIH